MKKYVIIIIKYFILFFMATLTTIGMLATGYFLIFSEHKIYSLV